MIPGPVDRVKYFSMKGQVHSYLVKLKKYYEAAANVENAFHMRAYMKDNFVFYGIRSDVRKEIFQKFIQSEGLPELEDLEQIVKDAWNLPQREYQYFAMELARRFNKKFEIDHLKMIEYMVTHKSWWDTVDHVASNLAGPYFSMYPDMIEDTIERWSSSKNMWLNRTAILFQLKYKENTDLELLFDVINKFKHSKEFFIQKAIGWSLREYSKTDPNPVKAFVKEAGLANLSEKEALKRVG